MENILVIPAIVALFYLLGKSADVVVINVKKIADKLGIRVFFLGLILGFLTSLPELLVGINSMIGNVSEISVGNLFGGIVVIFGLILGASAVVNRKIKTDGHPLHILPMLAFILFTIFLGADGIFTQFEGFVCVIAYFVLIFVLYNGRKKDVKRNIYIPRKELVKNFFLMAGGIILVILFSNLIIKLTLFVLKEVSVSPFVIGLIFFSLGTNLPEIVVAIRSWKRHIQELSISNLMGSAIANGLIVGILSSIKPIFVEINFSYVNTAIFISIIFGLFLYFYKTNKALTRNEGFVFLCLYALFIITQTVVFFL